MEQHKITSLSTEKRIFKPKDPFSKKAYIKSMPQYLKLYKESIRNPDVTIDVGITKHASGI